MSSSLDADAVKVASDLGREAAYARPITTDTGEDIDNTLIVRVVDTDHEVDVTDLEVYLAEPRHARGCASMHDAASFARYVTRMVGGAEAPLAPPRSSQPCGPMTSSVA